MNWQALQSQIDRHHPTVFGIVVRGLFIVFSCSIVFPQPALSQILPKGIFAVSVGQRQYHGSQQYFDATGSEKNYGSRFDTDFVGPKMADGQLGDEFKKLYDGVESTTDKSVADQLDFGRLRGSVDVGIKATFVGVGYGATKRLFLFGGLPIVDASVRSHLTFEDGNNAINGKSQLQSSVYTSIYRSLKDRVGLDMAKIKKTIEDDLAYKSVDSWQYQGPGDFVLGTRYRLFEDTRGRVRSYFDYGLKGLIPMGKTDDPDNLIDIPISKGHYQLSPSLNCGLTTGLIKLDFESIYSFGLPISTERRLPVKDEQLVAADRKVRVNLDPGDELNVRGQVGSNFRVLNAHVAHALTRTFKDKYKGSAEGNYDALANDSSRESLLQELGITASSVDAFKEGLFFMPTILSLTSIRTISGKNTARLNWYELSLTTFLGSSG
jgi:hypothetical protein